MRTSRWDMASTWANIRAWYSLSTFTILQFFYRDLRLQCCTGSSFTMHSHVLLFLQVWSHLYEAGSVWKVPYVCSRKEENVEFWKIGLKCSVSQIQPNKCEISFLTDMLPGTFGYCSEVSLAMSSWQQSILILCFSNPFCSMQTCTC